MPCGLVDLVKAVALQVGVCLLQVAQADRECQVAALQVGRPLPLLAMLGNLWVLLGLFLLRVAMAGAAWAWAVAQVKP
jgi:uncharacterized membrane protein (GlpM family)